MKDGGVTNGSLADGAVTPGKIADGAVTGSKIAGGAVGLNQLNTALQSSLSKFTTPLGPALVGSVATTAPVSVVTEGNYAYVLSGSALQIFDIRVPQTPAPVGSVSLASSNASYLAVQNRYAYIVNSGGGYMMQIVNATNPAAPALAGSVPSTHQLLQIAVAGNYAYSIGGGKLTVYDISNSAAPATVSETTLSGSNSLAVQGSYAYVGKSGSSPGLVIYDVSNPAAPAFQGSAATNIGTRSVAVSGAYAYVVAFGSNTVQTVDVSNPASPTVKSATTVNSPLHIQVSGGYAHVTTNNASLSQYTLSVLDLSQPAAPTVAAVVNTAAGPLSSAASNGDVYVACNAANLLQVFDTTVLTLRGNVTALNNFNVLGSLTVKGGADFGTIPDGPYVRALLNPYALLIGNKTGPCILAQSTDSFGILGTSSSYYGVGGQSVYGDAGHFFSSTGNGVWAHSDTTWAGYFDGPIRCAGFTNASDARLKTDIKDLENPLDSLLELRGVSFLYRKDGLGRNPMLAGKQIGFIAQEVETVFPELVTTDRDGYRSVNYIGVVPVLVEAVKTQQSQIDALKAKVAALETQNSTLKKQNDAIEELKKQVAALVAAAQKVQTQANEGRK